MNQLLFNEYKGNRSNIVKFLSHEIISRIASGSVRYGYEFPSVNKMHQNMSISRTTISKILQILSDNKYVTVQNGRVATVTYRCPVDKYPADPEITINAQGPVNTAIGSTHEKDKLFHARQVQFQKEFPLQDKTAIYPKLIEKCCSIVNDLQGTNYETNHIYYLDGTRLLYTSICTALNKDAPVFVVPNNFIMVKDILRQLNIKRLYVGVDEQGICVDEIANHCKNHKVKAVFFHSTAGFPFPYATADHRIAKLHELANIYQFKIIECGGYLPRLVSRPNPILDAFKPKLENVIYLWKLTRMQEEARNMILVAAAEEHILKISKTAKDLGCPLNLPAAVATHAMLSDKSFEACYEGNNDALKVLLDIIRQIFFRDDFWVTEVIHLENEPIFYLKPRVGRFLRSIFTKPKKPGNVTVKLLDPNLYLKKDDPVLALWIDLSYFIGQKNAHPKLLQFEKALRLLVKWKNVRKR